MSSRFRRGGSGIALSIAGGAVAAAVLALMGGCDLTPAPPPPSVVGISNSTDPTNGGAPYVGSDACASCHAETAAWQQLHAHAHALKPINGGPPDYPDEADRAAVPRPPQGFDWDDTSYVIGGYLRRALYVDDEGFVLTNGVTGVDTQWNLDYPPAATHAGFAPYEPGAIEPPPYGYDCFRCHTTGPAPLDPGNPVFQDGRPGLQGTWHEAGVQCEACHGPGGGHVSRADGRTVIDLSAIYVNNSADACGTCHTQGDPDVIDVLDGYIVSGQERTELAASGGHAQFGCTICHDPHRSVTYDHAAAIRNDCTACHRSASMALHDGFVFIRGDYVEELTCVSCHMPFATRNAAAAGPETVGEVGRMGDVRTHIFRIDALPQNYTAMLTGDGTAVRTDSAGRAAVTVDSVCLRCHNGLGNAFSLELIAAASVADDMHRPRR